MTYKQKKIQISAEDAINLIGCYYFINNGKHEEDFNLIIEQKLGKKSNFERDVETLDDAFELYDEILKQRCKNILNRYKKYYDSISGKAFYFLYRHGLLKDSRKKELDQHSK